MWATVSDFLLLYLICQHNNQIHLNVRKNPIQLHLQ